MSLSTATELEVLVQALRVNDDVAWRQLIVRFERMLRSIARSYRLNNADVDDVVQTVWVRLHEHVGRLREPDALAGWLATTARRESLRLLQAGTREHVTDDAALFDGAELERPESEVLAAERHDILLRALGTLPAHQRRLMVLLTTEPVDYRAVSVTLDMPIGSIGPTRARSVARLQDNPELQALHAAS
jgi:RNA polymerase sigma factor (sigma-70 family)